MFEQSRKPLGEAFNFLDNLDCYIGSQQWMESEIADFTSNPDRQIAALVCQNIEEMLTYEAPYLRILYVLNGSLELHIDQKIHHYSTGCLIMANEWTQMDYRQTQPGVEVVSFLFKKEYFSDALLNQMIEDSLMYRFFFENVKTEVKKSNFFVYQFIPNQDIHFYAMLLLKQTVKMKYKHNSITRGAFLLLVTEIHHLSDSHLQLKDSSLSSSILIYELLADIEANHLTISLTQLADKYFFHPNYLSAFIKEQTGKTFSQLLLASRMKMACNYLVQTNLSIQDIVEKIGYSDKTFFFKSFKKEYGLTPTQYRKAYQAEHGK